MKTIRLKPWASALVALACLAAVASGCAFTNPRNTPLLTMLDETVKPKTAWGKVTLGFVFVPVGVACAGLDIAALHPLHAIILGAEDTGNIVWANPKGSPTRFWLMVVPKAAVTPFVFVFAWFGESVFDLRPSPDSGRGEPVEPRKPEDKPPSSKHSDGAPESDEAGPAEAPKQ